MENEPEGQLVHAVDAEIEYVPALQFEQILDDDAAMAVEYVPAMQLLHSEDWASSTVEYLPAEQPLHDADVDDA